MPNQFLFKRDKEAKYGRRTWILVKGDDGAPIWSRKIENRKDDHPIHEKMTDDYIFLIDSAYKPTLIGYFPTSKARLISREEVLAFPIFASSVRKAKPVESEAVPQHP